MKLRLAFLTTIVATLFALSACAANAPAPGSGAGASGASATSGASADSGQTQLANPMVQVGGSDDFINELDIDLNAQPDATNIKYFIISSKIAQIDYTLAGNEISARAEKAAEYQDISGSYTNYAQQTSQNVGDTAVDFKYNENGEGIATWYNVAAGENHSIFQKSGATLASLLASAEYYING